MKHQYQEKLHKWQNTFLCALYFHFWPSCIMEAFFMWLENLKKYSLLKINLKTLIHTLKWTGLAFLFTFLPLYFLTCCDRERHRHWAIHREIFYCYYGQSTCPYACKKNLGYRPAGQPRLARGGRQSWKIGTFWLALHTYADNWFQKSYVLLKISCQDNWNSLKTRCTILRFTRNINFRRPLK